MTPPTPHETGHQPDARGRARHRRRVRRRAVLAVHQQPSQIVPIARYCARIWVKLFSQLNPAPLAAGSAEDGGRSTSTARGGTRCGPVTRRTANTPPPVPASLQPSASVESPRDLYRRALEAFTRLEATTWARTSSWASRGHPLAVHCGDDGHRPAHAPRGLGHELGQVRCGFVKDGWPAGRKFQTHRSRGEYPVGDKATNYPFMPEGYGQDPGV